MELLQKAVTELLYDYGPLAKNPVWRFSYGFLDEIFSTDKITAGISGAEYIEIIKQNFGFDLANEIVNVDIELEIPYYYMEVQNLTLR